MTDFIMKTDCVIGSLTVEELLMTARCNGEDIRTVFKDWLEIAIEDAEYMLDRIENEMLNEEELV